MTAAKVVNEYLDAYTSGDVETAASLVSEDFSFHAPMQASVGRDALRRMVAHVAPNARGCRILREPPESMSQVVGRHRAGVKLPALKALSCAGEQRQIWSDGERDDLPVARPVRGRRDDN